MKIRSYNSLIEVVNDCFDKSEERNLSFIFCWQQWVSNNQTHKMQDEFLNCDS